MTLHALRAIAIDSKRMEGIEAAITCAKARWPDIDVDAGTFAAYLAPRLPKGPEPMRFAVDAYLACACSAGTPKALEAFDREYLAQIPRALRRMKLDPADVDDIRQRVQEKLLVGDKKKIDDYAGRGDLGALVRVMAARMAVSEQRKEKRRAPDSAIGRVPADSPDPELQYIKARHREDFKAAFEAAAATLSGRERNLLRLHIVDGVTLERLADAYGVHRATIVRWLAKARRRLFSETKKQLRSRLALDGNEMSNLVRLVESRIDLSVRRILATRT